MILLQYCLASAFPIPIPFSLPISVEPANEKVSSRCLTTFGEWITAGSLSTDINRPSVDRFWIICRLHIVTQSINPSKIISQSEPFEFKIKFRTSNFSWNISTLNKCNNKKRSSVHTTNKKILLDRKTCQRGVLVAIFVYKTWRMDSCQRWQQLDRQKWRLLTQKEHKRRGEECSRMACSGHLEHLIS